MNKRSKELGFAVYLVPQCLQTRETDTTSGVDSLEEEPAPS